MLQAPTFDGLSFDPFSLLDYGCGASEVGVGGGTLLSAGGGLRTRVGKTYVNFESAFPLTANPVENGDYKPRFNFQIAKTF